MKKECLTEPEEHERNYILRKIGALTFYENVKFKEDEFENFVGDKVLEIYIDDLMKFFNADIVRIIGYGETTDYGKNI